MAITPPGPEQLRQIAARYGFALSPADLTSLGGLVAGALTSYDEVERLYLASRPEAPDRPWQWPAADGSGNELGAWYVRMSVRDEAAAGGPLAGRTVAVKDNIQVAGVPMMNGSASVEGYLPRRDATVVTRLLAAGATLAGKAVCEDLCFSGGSHTSRTGPVRNPWDRSRSAGGSSSGSAALVAAGLADLALGGDQGGSIRIPSAFCGTVGHKPTFGLVPYTGAFPIEHTIDHLGPITRTVRDAAVMLGVLAGPDGLDSRQRSDPPPADYLARLEDGVAGLRIGVLQEGFGIPGLSQPEVDATVRAAIDTLAAAGARVSPVPVPWHRHGMHVWNVIATDGVVGQMIDGNAYGMNTAGLYDPELMGHYARGRREHADELSETVKIVSLCGRYVVDGYDGRYYAMARNLALELTAAYDAALADHDVLVLPTLPITASVLPAAGASREEKVARSLEMIANTAPLDISGHPATSVPAGLARGLPVGLMIVGRHFDDATCLRVARACEAAAGGFPAPPARPAGPGGQ
ncbi:MAG TPA: amidase [Streptosporangiaceae bacterium]|nr:amidase [Streptosporangiaceae bacterium]